MRTAWNRHKFQKNDAPRLRTSLGRDNVGTRGPLVVQWLGRTPSDDEIEWRSSRESAELSRWSRDQVEINLGDSEIRPKQNENSN